MAQHSDKNRRSLIATIVIIALAAVVYVMQARNEAQDPSAPISTAAPASPARPFEGQGYVLGFGPDFDIGLSALDDLGLSVVIAIDQSGSMEDPPKEGPRTPKHQQAAQALQRIADFLEANFAKPGALPLKVGIIAFYEETVEVLPLTLMDRAGFAALRRVAKDPATFEPGGKTAIGKALELGTRMLAQSGTILRSLVVVSDGENNIDPEPEEVMRAIAENRNDASTVDFPVSTSGTLVSFVGFDIDSALFTGLHERGARVLAAADGDELEKALRSILLADIERLEAGN